MLLLLAPLLLTLLLFHPQILGDEKRRAVYDQHGLAAVRRVVTGSARQALGRQAIAAGDEAGQSGAAPPDRLANASTGTERFITKLLVCKMINMAHRNDPR